MSVIPIQAHQGFGRDEPEPNWEIARLFPSKGNWSVEEYLSLNPNRLAEYIDGTVEVLVMPTDFHQAIVAFLFEAMLMFVRPSRRGIVRFAPLRLRVTPSRYREPDLLYISKEHDSLRGDEFWLGADLVMEVVSDDDRRRDVETKRFDYARAGIPEYWIVDPKLKEITVLTLPAGAELYATHGVFATGQKAGSVLLPGFEVAVDDAFAAK